MNCALKVLVGMVLVPLFCVAVCGVAALPFYVTREILGVSELWGVLASMVGGGAVLGVLSCVIDR